MASPSHPPVPQSGPASSPSYLADAHCTHLAASLTPFSIPQSHPVPPTSVPFPPPAAPSPAPPHWVSAYPCFKSQESLPRGLSSSQRRRRGFDPWVGKIPRKEKWQPTLQYSFLKNSHRGAWQITVHGVKKSQT